MTKLWRGSQNTELLKLIEDSWKTDQLLILCPLHLKDFSFCKFFPEIEFIGDWEGQDLGKITEQLNPQAFVDVKMKKALFGIFTSGTQTGRPQLVFYSKENILSSLKGIRGLFDEKRIQKIFCYPQPTHTFGFVLGYLQSFLFSAELVVSTGPYTNESHSRWFENHDSNTLTLGTPTHFIDLLSWIQKNHLVDKVRTSYSAIIGGSNVTKKLWHRIKTELKIEQPSVGYGATEASPGLTHKPPGQCPLEDGDIGQALPGVHIDIHENQLEFSGPNVCLAYFQDGQIHFPEKIFLKDIVQKKGENYFFSGRSDLVLNRGGLKISMEHIENLVHSHLNVKCIASAIPDVRLGENIFLILQTEDEVLAEKTIALLQEFVQVRLKKENIIFGNIPLNENFKFDRKEARRLVYKKIGVQWPVKISSIAEFMPHRGSAIWVDQILSITKNEGIGQVQFDLSKPYCTNQELRKTACIEFIAQSFGYAVVLSDLLNITNVPKGQHAFIVDVRNVDFHSNSEIFKMKNGEMLNIETLCTNDFGNFKVVKGKVLLRDQILASADMKVFIN